MDDLISRQAAIDAINNIMPTKEGFLEPSEVLCELMQLPSAQPEIIRCKDCKNSRFFDPCFYCYEFSGEIIVPENGYCFMAERRADEQT